MWVRFLKYKDETCSSPYEHLMLGKANGRGAHSAIVRSP
jgi:hypothetical protein